MNVVEYFENEAKKSKSYLNIIDKKITKATGKTGCVMKTIHERGLLVACSIHELACEVCQKLLKVRVIT